MKKFVFILILSGLFYNGIINGQTSLKKRGIQFPEIVCYASDKVEKTFVPPPNEFLTKSGIEKKSDIIVTYVYFPTNAKTAIEYAVSIWEQIIESKIPIHIKANWFSINQTNVLANGGPSDYYANFEFAPRKNRYYPISVVEKITGTEISGSGSPDMEITFNKDIKWYYGTDGKTPDQLYDLVTVALHEIGHGLGFTGFFFVTGTIGTYGRTDGYIGDASAFDIMVADADGKLLTDTLKYKINSNALYNAFISDQLYSVSAAGRFYNSGVQPRLYAPSVFDAGSSIYHLNDNTYPGSDPNSLMTHAIGKGEAVHDPGPITKGILDDIGWKHMKLKLEKPKDIEVPKPIVFNLGIESDYPLDTASVKLIYSTDGYKNKRDTLRFQLSPDKTKFTVTLYPQVNSGRIDYYISARDNVTRTFYIPTEVPNEYLTVNIGPDTKQPQINHTPIPYFLANGSQIKINTLADDNLGIDTVWVEYNINGKNPGSFGLVADSAINYTGFFNLNPKLLKDGDLISYRIFAIDASKAHNQSVSPVTGSYSFKVEKLFDPIGGYINDFDYPTNDFVLSDFKIYTETGFKNPSLHSSHPYPSPNQNNKNLNFTTILKYPIVIKQNGTISYDEVVLVEPGEPLSKFGDDDFWDYVIVEGSKDLGATWLPVADGYDSGYNTVWKTNYNKDIVNQESKAVGIPDWYFKNEINLTANGNFKANDTILIRFRLFSDPYAHGWGWTIDNLRIQSPVSSEKVALPETRINVYPNPFKEVIKVEVFTEKTVEKLSVQIVNLFGQNLANTQLTDQYGKFIYEADLGFLPSGMYFVVVRENGQIIQSVKISKN